MLTAALAVRYSWFQYMVPIDHARKNGSAELLVLAQLETRARHGYEIASEIERRSGGAVSFQPASLYPVLYRMEREKWIAGRWVEQAGQRRRLGVRRPALFMRRPSSRSLWVSPLLTQVTGPHDEAQARPMRRRCSSWRPSNKAAFATDGLSVVCNVGRNVVKIVCQS
jgi:hypothetical protein